MMTGQQKVKFAGIIAVGPREQEIALDTLDSIMHYYPHAELYIADDCTDDGTYQALQTWIKKHPQCHLFRNETKAGYFYLTRTLASLLKQVVASSKDYEFVLKFDTDTLFVHDNLDQLFFERFKAEGPGLCGNHRYNSFNELRNYTKLSRKARLDTLPIGYTPKFPSKIRFGNTTYHSYLKKALQNGYLYGENVFGACYASHLNTVKGWYESGYLEALMNMGPSMLFEEDALMSIGTMAIGHKLIELEPPGTNKPQRAWLEWGGRELTISQEEVLAKGYWVLHQLKVEPGAMKMRKFFKARREAENN